MDLEEQIRHLEEEVAGLEAVARLGQLILGETMKAAPPSTRLEEVRSTLRSARDLGKHGDAAAAEKLLQQTQALLAGVRQWLALGDLGITPFALRTHLEQHPPEPTTHLVLIRYFLTKRPHAENDRDKIDFLLTAYFRLETSSEPEARWERPEELQRAFQELFAGITAPALSPADEVMRHEMESLIARIEDFADFDQLVQARVVERVRALKTNLGDAFYHPQLLPTMVRFNLAFRRRFDLLFQQQVTAAQAESRRRLEEAWELVRAIEVVYENLTLPPGERGGGPFVPLAGGAGELRVGRPLEALDERPPMERLLRPAEVNARGKENELRGIINRLARFLEKLTPEQGRAERVVFPLRHAHMELVAWEREAFSAAAVTSAPSCAHSIQSAVGLVAWMEEELAQYNQARPHRYLWKTHFDAITYAVGRSVELLKTIHALLRPEGPEAEAAWFEPLLHTALRLGIALHHVAPVFDEPLSP